MKDKIEITIAYYDVKRQEILNKVNGSSNLTADEIIHFGEEMAILEYKMTALEVAREN